MEQEFRAVDVEEIARGPRKRQTAYKLRIADLQDSHSQGIVEFDGKQIIRVNLIANVIDKMFSESEKKYSAITLDDASSQIRVKTFGEDIEKLREIDIGDTLLVIGNVRFFNNELYILPEIVRKLPVEWLLVRKLELGERKNEKARKNNFTNEGEQIIEEKISEEKPQDKDTKQKIIEMLKANEEGINMDSIIMDLHEPADDINSIVASMLENGEIYEPRPGRIRLL